MTRVLITGAFGFIGLNLINRLIKDGVEKIYVIDKNYPLMSDYEQIEVISHDLADLDSISKLELDGAILLAGISGKNITEKETIFKVNVDMNLSLIKTALQTNDLHVIIPSSQLVYEAAATTGETLDLRPTTLYAQSKLELEKQMLELAKQERGLTVTSFRISNPFGPHIPHPQNYNYANQMLYKLMHNESIELFNNGELTKNFIPIQNVCKIMSDTLQKGLFSNELVNLGHYLDISLKNFYELAQTKFASGNITYSSQESYEIAELDTSKLYAIIDKESLLDLASSLELFEKFFKEHEQVSVDSLITAL